MICRSFTTGYKNTVATTVSDKELVQNGITLNQETVREYITCYRKRDAAIDTF